MILYSYWRSSCSYRVRIALEFLDCKYEYRPIHLVKDGGEQLKPEYLALNPMAQVPYFIHKDLKLSQSMAIIEYLNAIFPDKDLIPKDPVKAAKVREICEVINSGTQPVQNLGVLKTLVNEYGLTEEQKMQWGKHFISKGLQVVESLIPEGNSFCVGEKFSIADALLIPQIYNANRFSVDMSKLPKISAINDHCLQLSYFQKASPTTQPDTQ